MKRYAAVAKNVGAEKIWAGKVDIEPDAKLSSSSESLKVLFMYYQVKQR